MTKKVNFYTVDLHVSVNANEERKHVEIKNHLIEIINEKSVKQDGFWVLDLSDENQLHQIADIFRMITTICL